MEKQGLSSNVYIGIISIVSLAGFSSRIERLNGCIVMFNIKLEWETERDWKELIKELKLQHERAYSFFHDVYWSILVRNNKIYNSNIQEWVTEVRQGVEREAEKEA